MHLNRMQNACTLQNACTKKRTAPVSQELQHFLTFRQESFIDFFRLARRPANGAGPHALPQVLCTTSSDGTVPTINPSP